MKIMLKLHVVICITLFCISSVCFAETVNLRWNAPTSGGPVDGYNLYYGLNDNISAMTKIEGITETSYSLDGLALHNTYYFYVRAYNTNGEGPVSPVRVSSVSLRVVE